MQHVIEHHKNVEHGEMQQSPTVFLPCCRQVSGASKHEIILKLLNMELPVPVIHYEK